MQDSPEGSTKRTMNPSRGSHQGKQLTQSSSLLEEVLAQKKMEVMRSPAVSQWLEELQRSTRDEMATGMLDHLQDRSASSESNGTSSSAAGHQRPQQDNLINEEVLHMRGMLGSGSDLGAKLAEDTVQAGLFPHSSHHLMNPQKMGLDSQFVDNSFGQGNVASHVTRATSSPVISGHAEVNPLLVTGDKTANIVSSSALRYVTCNSGSTAAHLNTTPPDALRSSTHGVSVVSGTESYYTPVMPAVSVPSNQASYQLITQWLSNNARIQQTPKIQDTLEKTNQ